MPKRSPKKLGRKLKKTEFYCVSCRKAVTASKNTLCFADVTSSKRKKIPTLKGYCPKCDRTLNKFVKNSSAKDLRRQYGRC